jgi:hypothetical protein
MIIGAQKNVFERDRMDHFQPTEPLDALYKMFTREDVASTKRQVLPEHFISRKYSARELDSAEGIFQRFYSIHQFVLELECLTAGRVFGSSMIL